MPKRPSPARTLLNRKRDRQETALLVHAHSALLFLADRSVLQRHLQLIDDHQPLGKL
jgi:hypothetical protein